MPWVRTEDGKWEWEPPGPVAPNPWTYDAGDNPDSYWGGNSGFAQDIKGFGQGLENWKADHRAGNQGVNLGWKDAIKNYFTGADTPAANTGDQATYTPGPETDRRGMGYLRGLKSVGQNPNGDPNAEPDGKWAWLFEETAGTGGTAGYDNRGAVSAYFNEMRQRAEEDKLGAQQDLTGVYDQLAGMMKPMAGQTAAAYDSAIAAGADQSQALITATEERINSEAAMRASQFAELGISGGGGLSDTSAEAERGMSDIGANASNWTGLMGALSTGQQARNNQDYIGAGDAKTMAIEDLVSRYSDYLQAINSQESEQMATAYQPGTAGQPGPMMWETMGAAGQGFLENWGASRGYGPMETPEDPYMPTFAKDQQYAMKKEGVTPAQLNWMQSQKDSGMPMDITNPLYNPRATEYLS